MGGPGYCICTVTESSKIKEKMEMVNLSSKIFKGGGGYGGRFFWDFYFEQ